MQDTHRARSVWEGRNRAGRWWGRGQARCRGSRYLSPSTTMTSERPVRRQATTRASSGGLRPSSARAVMRGVADIRKPSKADSMVVQSVQASADCRGPAAASSIRVADPRLTFATVAVVSARRIASCTAWPAPPADACPPPLPRGTCAPCSARSRGRQPPSGSSPLLPAPRAEAHALVPSAALLSESPARPAEQGGPPAAGGSVSERRD